MPCNELPKTLAFTIIQTGKLLLKKVNSSFANLTSEITFEQIGVLYYISCNKGKQISQQDLAKWMEKTTSTMVKTIDILEKKGFAKRVTVADNRRKNSIELTKNGNLIVNKMHLILIKQDEILENGITKKDFLGCISVLLKIQDNCK
ncbi:MarR family winged helix-turn-helix transcriptional regulator [Flavobacterium sp. UBA7680]|uniref:MarR family winged helix-turn-helix transcriptional regulator n=1 Tax=Flavobacterium sp. UBA7680 TaxID=1946559 RepID=UPI0025C5A701|nr:MarR family transcriptional regulator [Flavobacterium sp. UBA7680]